MNSHLSGNYLKKGEISVIIFRFMTMASCSLIHDKKLSVYDTNTGLNQYFYMQISSIIDIKRNRIRQN